MKKLLLLIVVVSLTISLFANNEKSNTKKTEDSKSANTTTILRGKVIDQITGEALTGVKVLIEETNQVVYTDFSGNFSFSSVVPGEYNIKVNYISYNANVLQKVNLNGIANAVKIELKTVNQ